MSEVTKVAKEVKASNSGNIVTLSDGRKAKLVPVSASLIDAVTRRVKPPEVPKVWIADKEREEENPNDPSYVKAVEEYDRLRGTATMDAMVLFGVELLDGVPEGDDWLKKLKYLERRGGLDLSEYDLDDPMDREYVYKRFIAVPLTLINRITEISGISAQEVEVAEDSFQGN